ncbi:MAG TPA: murein biosynthesis integral membrane protein MurJ [Anaerolineae bacterium]|nr:murein biosynthesis integral membrane protein MurJ [Anaerolineae bacterium]
MQSAQPSPRAPRAAGVLQAAFLVTVLTLVVKGLGFAEKLLLAYFFGTGHEVDAYLVAYSIPFSAFIVLRDVVEPAFLPVFLTAERREEGLAWRLFSTTGLLLVLLMGGLTAAGVSLAQPLIALAAPGFGAEQRVLAVRLLRVVMPALLFLSASSLTTAVLHAKKRFGLPAAAEACFRAGSLLLLAMTGGVAGTAVGMAVGAMGKLLLEVLGLRRHLARPRPCIDLKGPVRQVGRLGAPLLAALALSLFVAPLVENAFASRLGVGSVAALAYSRKIAETLTTIVPYALGLVLLPFSAEMAARQDAEGLALMLTRALRGLVLLFAPVTVGLLVLREPFVRLLLERGAFSAASTELTAQPLLFYALALLPFGLEIIIIQFFFARQDTMTPVLADVVSFVLNIALIPLLLQGIGLGGIALAAALAKAAKVFTLLILFGRKVPAFRLPALGRFGCKVSIASLTATAALLAWVRLAGAAASAGGLAVLAVYLFVGGLLAGGVFLLAVHLLGVEEPANAWRLAWRWCHARRGRAAGRG